MRKLTFAAVMAIFTSISGASFADSGSTQTLARAFDGSAPIKLDNGGFSDGTRESSNLSCIVQLPPSGLKGSDGQPIKTSCAFDGTIGTIPDEDGVYHLNFYALDLARVNKDYANDFRDYTAECSGLTLDRLSCLFSPAPVYLPIPSGNSYSGGCSAGAHRESYIGECVPDTNATGG